jgi:hypothetical protein
MTQCSASTKIPPMLVGADHRVCPPPYPSRARIDTGQRALAIPNPGNHSGLPLRVQSGFRYSPRGGPWMYFTFVGRFVTAGTGESVISTRAQRRGEISSGARRLWRPWPPSCPGTFDADKGAPVPREISPLRPVRLRSGQALRPPVEMTIFALPRGFYLQT